MTLMSMAQIERAYDCIPKPEDLHAALATVPIIQDCGNIRYDVIQAGEALVKYYQRVARQKMARHEARKKQESMFYLNMAERFRQRSEQIEQKLKELKEYEDHKAVV